MSEAHEAIRNLLGSYCEVMDAGDFAALGRLFADGELVDDQGRRIARGSSPTLLKSSRSGPLTTGRMSS